jgi:HTH-type transcriptional regulator / antitoxin HigA
MMEMDIRPLKTEADYDRALVEIAPYFDQPPPLDTPGAARFDVLAALIESCEARHWPIDAPDPAPPTIPSGIQSEPCR